MPTVGERDLRRSGSIMAEERLPTVGERDRRRSGSIMAEEQCRL